MSYLVVSGYITMALAVSMHLFLWRARFVDRYRRELWHKVGVMFDADFDIWRLEAFHSVSTRRMVLQFWRRPSSFHNEEWLLHPRGWNGVP